MSDIALSAIPNDMSIANQFLLTLFLSGIEEIGTISRIGSDQALPCPGASHVEKIALALVDIVVVGTVRSVAKCDA